MSAHSNHHITIELSDFYDCSGCERHSPRTQAGHEGSVSIKPNLDLPTRHRVALVVPEVPLVSRLFFFAPSTCRLPPSIYLGTTSSQTAVEVDIGYGSARHCISSATVFGITTPTRIHPQPFITPQTRLSE